MAEGARILIIDDEASIRDSVAAYLEDSDFETLEAENGPAGIEQCRQHHPDLVLCDLRMPEMDGLEVLAQITVEFPELPIIIVSGVGRLADAIEALKLGAWDYLTKPIADMAVLEHAVRKALERARLRQENRAYQAHLEKVNQQLAEDEQAGRRVQFQLLPDDDRLFGRYRFCRRLFTSTYVSGDFVDYFSIDEHRIGFYLADVSGHGVSSALVTVLLKSYVSRELNDYWQRREQTILHPDRLLAKLNEALLSQPLGKYATMLYGVIDTLTNTLKLANGGQFPHPVLFGGDDRAFVGGKGLPVGLFDHARYQNMELPLPDRFILFLASDGILECLPGSNLSEKKETMLSLIDSLQLTMDRLIATLALEHTDGTLTDDVTLLMIKREG